MVEEKFTATEDGPVNVFEDGPAVGIGSLGQEIRYFLLLFCGWTAAEGAEVKVFDDFVVWAVVFDEFGDSAVFGFELLVDGVAVGNVENLGNAGFHGAFAFAGFFAVRATESFEEI